MTLIRVDARHTACAGLIQRRVPRESAIDRRSPVVWGCELGLKELKPRQLYERLLRQSITGRCVWWCENESDSVVSSGDHRSRRERGGVTGVGRVRGTGGDWSVIDHAAQPLPTPPLSPPRTCPLSMLNYTVWTAGFCPVSGTFCINRFNRPIIGRLFGTDYRPTDNRPVRYRCIPRTNYNWCY